MGPIAAALLLLGACAGPPAAVPSGVIVVSLDTLRADRLGAYGSRRGLTPNLDRFAAESIVIENAFAQANETLPSHASLYTSRYPGELGMLDGVLDGVFDTRFVPRGDAPTLAASFHAAGWRTAAFVAGGHLARAFGLAAGFATYDDTAAWGSLRDTAPRALRWLDANVLGGGVRGLGALGRGARDAVDPAPLAADALDADALAPDTLAPDALDQGPRDPVAAGRNVEGSPFLLLVHGYDTHDRYLKPPPFGYAIADATYAGLGAPAGRLPGGSMRVVGGHLASSVEAVERVAVSRTRFDRGAGIEAIDPGAKPLAEADIAHLAGLYDGATAWMDACFGLFMAGLEERGLLDEVVVIVLSDHGEELGEHGAFEHRASLTDETLHVPLLVRLPGGTRGGQRLDGLVALLDVAPTALDLAGIPIPSGARGRSLRAALSGEGAVPARSAVFSEGALRLLSARGPGARLTAEGLSADHPLGPALLAAAPVDGLSLRLTGDSAESDTLRAALVDWRRAVHAPDPKAAP